MTGYTFYNSPEACAHAAEPLFAKHRWRWSDTGIPKASDILQNLLRLRSTSERCGYNYLSSGRLAYFAGQYGHQEPSDSEAGRRGNYITDKFDRRMFNPDKNFDHHATLERLRQVGSSRACSYLYGFNPAGQSSHYDLRHFRCCGSYALTNLWHYGFEEKSERDGKEFYLDIGAGNSPDALIARRMGYEAHSLDLFLPTYPLADALKNAASKFYVKADALQLPFADYSFDYISSQAMIALVPPGERLALYREVFRVLKIGGTFSMTGANLKCGYGFRQGMEVDRARTLSWELASMENGFIGQRHSDT